MRTYKKSVSFGFGVLISLNSLIAHSHSQSNSPSSDDDQAVTMGASSTQKTHKPPSGHPRKPSTEHPQKPSSGQTQKLSTVQPQQPSTGRASKQPSTGQVQKPSSGHDQPVTMMEPVEVEGRARDLIGITSSASQGEVGQPEFQYRPLSRVGELIETVPGMMATQHSGSGKANQYFLRGFNLDHGTDFATWVDGIQMNMPTHAHGQGYMDLNSIIPELVDKVEYGKGPYYANAGDFSTAGYARMSSMDHLDKGFVKLTGGSYDYYRLVAADSEKLGGGTLLYAGEFQYYNGAWQTPEDTQKFNGMLRWTLNEGNWGLSVFGKAYHNSWTATNQIPLYAVQTEGWNLFQSGSPTDGGISNRYSVSTNFWGKGDNWKNDFNAFVLYTDLDLYSNFTGYLVNPTLGDQMEQKERRWEGGANGEQTWFNQWFGFDMDNTLGFQLRHDSISGLGLNQTVNRVVWQQDTLHNVSETMGSIFVNNKTQWLSKFKTVTALRGDFLGFDVTSLLASDPNSGSKYSGIFSPKLSLIFGPWAKNEFFINMGYGFHSNDVRGSTNAIITGGATSVVTSPLTRQRGAEIGWRSEYVPGLNTTLAFWYLHSGSELVWAADQGTNDPTGPSNRYGVEWTNYYKPVSWATLDADFAFSQARYTNVPSDQSWVPNAVHQVITAGAVFDLTHGFFATTRVRHMGGVPLTVDGTLTQGNTTLVSMGLGYQNDDYKFELDAFNLLNSKQNDIAYAYQYRTLTDVQLGINAPGQGVNSNPNGGIVLHPVEPQMFRFSATLKF